MNKQGGSTNILNALVEQRIREIAREEAIAVAIAASHTQAEIAACRAKDRLRISETELQEFLSAPSSGILA